MNNFSAWPILQHQMPCSQYYNKSGFVFKKKSISYTLLWQCSIFNTLALQPSPQHISFAYNNSYSLVFGWQARDIKRGGSRHYFILLKFTNRTLNFERVGYQQLRKHVNNQRETINRNIRIGRCRYFDPLTKFQISKKAFRKMQN